MDKILVVNADDFGLHSSINKGVECAIKEGVVNSVSCITNTVYFEDMLRIIKSHMNTSIGVHLNITDGKPLSPPEKVRLLLDNKGLFFGDHLKVARALISHPGLVKQVRYEFELQIKKLSDNQIRISHIDSHGYIHLLPVLFKVVSELACAFRIPFIRIPNERLFIGNSFPTLHMVVLKILSRYAQHTLSKRELRYAAHFVGLRYSGKTTTMHLLTIIKQLKYGITEIAVHPGDDSKELSQVFQWGFQWREELLGLISEEVKKTIKAEKITLANFNQLCDLLGF